MCQTAEDHAGDVTAVNRLYLSLNGTGFAWDSAKRMHRRNAETFWKGVTIEVLR